MESGRFYWKSAERGNTSTFLEFVYQLRKRSAGKHTIVILDNASYHHSLKVRKFEEKYDDVSFFYLPTYSPEYNPVEQVWKWLKRKIYDASPGANDINDVISRVRKLIWHWREGNLVESLNVGIGVWCNIFIDISAG